MKVKKQVSPRSPLIRVLAAALTAPDLVADNLSTAQVTPFLAFKLVE